MTRPDTTPTPAPNASITPAALLGRAQACLETLEYDLCRKFLVRALEIDPHHIETLEMLGTLELDCAGAATAESVVSMHLARATQYLTKAIELRPETGSEKYLCMGQLATGRDALAYYEQGLRLLENEKACQGDAKEEDVSASKMASALCSMVEIYMTDCCDEPDAEALAESYCLKAISLTPDNPEPHQTLASVRISQSDLPSARASIEKSLDQWELLPLDHRHYPSYATRLGCVKILIELDLFDRALLVLQSLQRDRDEDPEVWYLFGWCYFRWGGGTEIQAAESESLGGSRIAIDESLMHVSDDAERVEHWEDAIECFETAMSLLVKNEECSRSDIAEHAELLCGQLKLSMDVD
ncbi:hypothetical protein SeMB42_g07751 [Synchytrium endobioticum]|uniref:Uncharacterized protein n=1 Tax=Synchytrium endobioticum TaxID=286115 RepID=A0A507CW78_9FUNG|nr:hypothetical protein SeMB42_g07751 [Synchytrium endobioticum]TPX43403.1 hypothetical protein SeLEV6574_g05081 [Synchytrium endobioticum]